MNIPYASSIYYPLNMCIHDVPNDSFSIQQDWMKNLIFLMLFSPFYCFSCTAQFTTLYVSQPILMLCITSGSLQSIACRLKHFGMLSCINLQHPRFESYCAAVCINMCSEHTRLFFFYPTLSSKQHKLMSTPQQMPCYLIISYITILFTLITTIFKLSLAVLLWSLMEQKRSHLLAHYE